MTQHEGKGLQFEVPDDWEDRSIVAYSAPSSKANPNAPNVVVTNDKLEDGEDATKYANRQLGQLAKQLNGFRLQDQRDLVIAGLPAKELAFTWLGARGRIVQRLAMVMQGSKVINVTTTVPAADTAKLAPVFQQILGSLRISAPANGAPVGGGTQAAVSTAPLAALGSLSPRPPSVPPPDPAMSKARSVPPPSLSPPRSSEHTQVLGARAIADASGRARTAAAAAWQRPVEQLVARDLNQYVPWVCRHEVVYVTNNAEFGVVVASGAGDPLLFADPAHLTELNTFMRNENVALPGGLPPNDLAQAIRTLLYGPEGYVGSPGFFQRERERYDRWMGHRSQAAERAFRAHCEGAVLNARPEGWALLFSCFARQGGVERWEVTGKGNRIQTATFTGEDKQSH